MNGRDFTNLLSLQPGVVPFQYANALQDSNLSDRTVGGSSALNGGNQSINGQRETSNGYMVNGANVEEGKNNGTSVIPNLDSIEEFRIITNNFDAEYGNYSGGQVNVVTKSGTNSLHGSVFEFNRNTAFNARNYFNMPTPGSESEGRQAYSEPVRHHSRRPDQARQAFLLCRLPRYTANLCSDVSAAVPDGTFRTMEITVAPTESTALCNGVSERRGGVIGGHPSRDSNWQQISPQLSDTAVTSTNHTYFPDAPAVRVATRAYFRMRLFPGGIVPGIRFRP